MACGILRHAKFQLCLYTVGMLSGIAALLVFYPVMGNLEASLIGGISALYAGYLVCDIWRNHNIKDGREILPLHESKRNYYLKFFFALFGFVGSLALMVFFITRAIVRGEPMDGPSYMAAIQSWMFFKWAMAWVNHIRHSHTPKGDLAGQVDKPLMEA